MAFAWGSRADSFVRLNSRSKKSVSGVLDEQVLRAVAGEVAQQGGQLRGLGPAAFRLGQHAGDVRVVVRIGDDEPGLGLRRQPHQLPPGDQAACLWSASSAKPALRARRPRFSARAAGRR